MRIKSFLKKIISKDKQTIQYFSQDGQDRYLDEHIFSQKKNGTFIEIGAHNGITFSNTYFFEKYRKWAGICIEPNPEVFKQLKSNRKAKCINACISRNVEKVNYVKVSGYSEMLSGILEFYNDEHWNRLERELKEHGGSKEIIKVNSFTLTEILHTSILSNKKIDFCSIDVEGAELDILRSIDFDKIDILVFAIENNYNTDDIYLFLRDKGYEKVAKVGADEIFRKT
jgi:FkbM family methyltransferase